MFIISRGNEALTDVMKMKPLKIRVCLGNFKMASEFQKNTNFDERFLLHYEHSEQNILGIT